MWQKFLQIHKFYGKSDLRGDLVAQVICGTWYFEDHTITRQSLQTFIRKMRIRITSHPLGLRFIRDDEIPVSKSVQLMVPSEDAAYIISSFAGLNLQDFG